jgi:hypothetical protein
VSDPRRRPHTFYLTDALWEELDRRHHAERARVGARATKNEFIERILRLGLAATDTTPAERPVQAAVAPPTPARVARTGRERRDPLDELRRASAPGRPAPISSAADASSPAA